MSGKAIFLFNLWGNPNANDLSLLIISLFVSHQDIMLFSVSKLDVNSFMFFPVISILTSSWRIHNLHIKIYHTTEFFAGPVCTVSSIAHQLIL